MKRWTAIAALGLLFCSAATYNDSELRERVTKLEEKVVRLERARLPEQMIWLRSEVAVLDEQVDTFWLAYSLDEFHTREVRCNQQRLQWLHPETEWGWCEPGEGIQ